MQSFDWTLKSFLWPYQFAFALHREGWRRRALMGDTDQDLPLFFLPILWILVDYMASAQYGEHARGLGSSLACFGSFWTPAPSLPQLAVQKQQLPCHPCSFVRVIQPLNLRQRGSDLWANCTHKKSVSYEKTTFLWSCSDAALRCVWGSGLPGTHLSGCQGEFLLVRNDSKHPLCVSSNVLNFKE